MGKILAFQGNALYNIDEEVSPMKTKRFKNVISVLCVAVLLAVALPIAINAQDGQKLQKQADVSVQQNDAVIENNLNSDKGGNVSSAQKENIKNYVQNNAIATAQKRKALKLRLLHNLRKMKQ